MSFRDLKPGDLEQNQAFLERAKQDHGPDAVHEDCAVHHQPLSQQADLHYMDSILYNLCEHLALS